MIWRQGYTQTNTDCIWKYLTWVFTHGVGKIVGCGVGDSILPARAWTFPCWPTISVPDRYGWSADGWCMLIWVFIFTKCIVLRCGIGFCQKLADAQAPTVQKIPQGFGDDTVAKTQVKVRYTCFKHDHSPVENEACTGGPSRSQNTELIETVWQIVMEDHCVTMQEIIDEDEG